MQSRVPCRIVVGYMNPFALTRRELLSAVIAAPLGAAEDKQEIFRYLEGLARPDGGYGWAADPHSHLTPTFAVLGCYRLLGKNAHQAS